MKSLYELNGLDFQIFENIEKVVQSGEIEIDEEMSIDDIVNNNYEVEEYSNNYHNTYKSYDIYYKGELIEKEIDIYRLKSFFKNKDYMAHLENIQ